MFNLFNSANLAEVAHKQSESAAIKMIDDRCDVNAVDQRGNTALHWAAWHNMNALTKKLIDAGCDPKVRNRDDEVPAHWAAKCSNTYVLNMLKTDISQLSVRDRDGYTPMIIAAQSNSVGMLEWLYLHGVSVEEQDNLGRTALFWASYKNNQKTVQWLLSRGAFVGHRDTEGTTALHWAAAKGFEEVAEMIMDVGGVVLVDAADVNGDTPLILAKRNHQMLSAFFMTKAKYCYKIFGRPYFSHNYFANVFLCLMAWCGILSLGCIFPNIRNDSVGLNLFYTWLGCFVLTLILWTITCFSDPGWLASKTILPQYNRLGPDPNTIFDANLPTVSQMIDATLGCSACPGSAHKIERLHTIESDLRKCNFQRNLVRAAMESLDDMHEAKQDFLKTRNAWTYYSTEGDFDSQMSYSEQREQLEEANRTLLKRIDVMGTYAKQYRIDDLDRQGLGDYTCAVMNGEFSKVCLICRCVKEMRSHHCRCCGRCVSRLDHHCPWIDNCVGLGNQRSFVAFVSVLFLTICFWYAMTFTYAWAHWNPTKKGLAPFIPYKSWSACRNFTGGVLLMLTAAMNFVWLGFSCLLVVRSFGYMIANVTAFEVLTTPLHIRNRFPTDLHSRWWFLRGVGIWEIGVHCFSFWTKSLAFDHDVFKGAPIELDHCGHGPTKEYVRLGLDVA